MLNTTTTPTGSSSYYPPPPPSESPDLQQLPPPLTPHQQRRRAALLADSPENHPSSNRRCISRSNFDDVELYCEKEEEEDEQQERRDDNNSKLCCCCCCTKCCAKVDRTFGRLRTGNVWKSILLGQLLSLLLCCSAVLCQILVENYNVRLPSGQNLLHYILLCIFYLSLIQLGMSKTGDSISVILRRRGLRYFFLAIVDVEANYLNTRAFQYTTLTGVQLLDCFSLPTVLILSWLLLRARYKLSHIGGLALALMSVVTIVWVDVEDGKGGVAVGGKDRLIGDMLTLCSAFLTGITYVGLEHSVKFYDAYEFLGFVGFFGSILTVLQISLLERSDLLATRWELWEVCVLLLALAVAQFVRLSCLPLMLKLSSSAGLNLSLLAADFYSIMAGVVFFQYKFHALYFLAITLVFLGLLIFNLQPVPLDTTAKSEEFANLSSSPNASSPSVGGGGASARSSQTTLIFASSSQESKSSSTPSDLGILLQQLPPPPHLSELNFCARTPCSVQPTSLPTVEIHTMATSTSISSCGNGRPHQLIDQVM